MSAHGLDDCEKSSPTFDQPQDLQINQHRRRLSLSPKRARTSSECSANSTVSTLTPPPSSSTTTSFAANSKPTHNNSSNNNCGSFVSDGTSAGGAGNHVLSDNIHGDNFSNGNDLNENHSRRSPSTSPTTTHRISPNHKINSGCGSHKLINNNKTNCSVSKSNLNSKSLNSTNRNDHHSSSSNNHNFNSGASCSTNSVNHSNCNNNSNTNSTTAATLNDTQSTSTISNTDFSIRSKLISNNNNNQNINLNTETGSDSIATAIAIATATNNNINNGNNATTNNSSTSVSKRSMDNVLKRLSNKMKGSSIRDSQHKQQKHHQLSATVQSQAMPDDDFCMRQSHSKNPSPTSAKSSSPR